MKKIRRRAVSVLLIAALVICGMVSYVIRYIDDGQEWALYFSRSNSGSTGQLVDRNGEMLAYFNGFQNVFANDPITRQANYHVTGDYWGRTGTGVLSNFWSEMQGFDHITGTTVAKHSTMILNIDSRLNNIMYKHLAYLRVPRDEDEVHVIVDTATGEITQVQPEWCNSAMLLCNYKTGELLGMISLPTVDPMDNETPPADGAYINRCLSASFIPGSVFKLVTAAAAIENIEGLDEKSFYCEHEYLIAGVPIVCMATHLNQTFEQAMANSCNVAFSQMAVSVGHETMIKYVRDYGFLDRHELDGISTAAGSYPLDFVGDPELGWSGIGQSTDLVCPYSMLRFVSAIANGGILHEPKLIWDGEPSQASRLMEAETANKLKELMSYNVAASYDPKTFPNLNMCAKTGTAETGTGDSHSWFVGFLDDEEHPYAFVTMVEKGGGGLAVAGRTTNKILQEYIFGE